MGREIPEHELAFLAPIPYMALGAKGNVEKAFFRLHEPSAHRKSDALKRRLALTEHQPQMLLFFTHAGGRSRDCHPTCQ